MQYRLLSVIFDKFMSVFYALSLLKRTSENNGKYLINKKFFY